MWIGNESLGSRELGDQVFDLSPRRICVRDHKYALPACRPISRKKRELGSEERSLAIARRRLDVTGCGISQEVDLARTGKIAAAQFVTKFSKQFRRERQDL
jgi:hypothetical protein